MNQKNKSERVLRSPSKNDIDNSKKWLTQAESAIDANEFHRAKRFCKQVIRALRRKDSE